MAFDQLPIELLFRILDHFDPIEIRFYLRDVSKRLNDVIDVYQPFCNQNKFDGNFEVRCRFGLDRILRSFYSDRTIESLIISHAVFNIEHLAKISHLFTINHTLTSLDLTSTRIQGDEDFVLARYLSDILKTNRVLTTLVLNSNDLNSDDIRILGDALRINETLKILKLRENDLRDDGTRHLCEVLKSGKTLIELDLTSNGITDVGAEALAELLMVNQNLIVLSLEKNYIDDRGVEHLIKALRTNGGLINLHLNENLFSKSSAEALAKLKRIDEDGRAPQ